MNKEKKPTSEEKLDWKDYLAIMIALLQTVLTRFVLFIVATMLVGLVLILLFAL
jgi:hypothetical protein